MTVLGYSSRAIMVTLIAVTLLLIQGANAASINTTSKHTVLIVGDGGVGKTSIWRGLQHLPFLENTHPVDTLQTMTFDYQVILANGKEVTLSVVDPGRTEEENDVEIANFRYADAIVIVYAVDNTDSFEDVIQWFSDAYRPGWLRPGFSSFLVGTKIDQPQIVTDEEQRSYAGRLKATASFRVSAKNDPEYIRSLFNEIAKIVSASQ